VRRPVRRGACLDGALAGLRAATLSVGRVVFVEGDKVNFLRSTVVVEQRVPRRERTSCNCQSFSTLWLMTDKLGAISVLSWNIQSLAVEHTWNKGCHKLPRLAHSCYVTKRIHPSQAGIRRSQKGPG